MLCYFFGSGGGFFSQKPSMTSFDILTSPLYEKHMVSGFLDNRPEASLLSVSVYFLGIGGGV